MIAVVIAVALLGEVAPARADTPCPSGATQPGTTQCSTEVTLTVPARNPSSPPPSSPPPNNPPGPGNGPGQPGSGGAGQGGTGNQVSWNSNSRDVAGTNPTGAPTTQPSPPDGTQPTAPSVSDHPKAGAGGAYFEGDPNPQPGAKGILVGDGFVPGEKVQVVIFSAPVVVGSWPASPDGRFRQEIDIPTGLKPGVHTAELTGWQSGTVRNVDFQVRPASWATAAASKVWLWWLGGGLGLLLVAAAVVAVVIGRRRQRTADTAGAEARS